MSTVSSPESPNNFLASWSAKSQPSLQKSNSGFNYMLINPTQYGDLEGSDAAIFQAFQ